jgi:hypothetical protein
MTSKYLIISLIVLGLLFGCICPLTDCTTGSGNVVSEDRTIGSFDSIELGTEASLTLTQDSAGPLHIEAEDNLIDNIETKVENGVLKIYNKGNACFTITKPIRIKVSAEEIKKLSVLGSGKITSTNTIQSDDLDLSVMGSGEIDLDSQAKNIKVNIPGSGGIRLGGNTTTMDVSILGSGYLKAFDLPAQNAKVTITGSGEAEVNVDKELNVSIMGSGSVYYKGNASVSKSVSGSGNVKDMN